jgi:hypothetical protein
VARRNPDGVRAPPGRTPGVDATLSIKYRSNRIRGPAGFRLTVAGSVPDRRDANP